MKRFSPSGFLRGAAFSTLILSVAAPVFAQVEADLQKRISSAQSSLNTTEQKISRERASFAREINALERDVRGLEKQTAAARRLEDEKNLSLTKLQERLNGWISQRNYQNNLIQQFLRQQGGSATAIAGETVSTEQRLRQIADIASASEGWLEPTFKPVELALDNGDIVSSELLSLGPVHWAIADGQAYSVTSKEGEWQSIKHLPSDAASALTALQEGQEAVLYFDPSLSQFDQIPDESILDHLEKGGVWALPILLFALIALVIGVLKAFQLLRLPQVVSFTPAALRNAVETGKSVFSAGSMQQGLFDIAREIRQPRERDDQLFLQLQEYRVKLEQRLTAIAITASVAPLLGLLGTVSGMIETFRMMTLFGSGNPEVVSGGISQALITTELGLVVAIPALVVHSLLSRRARAYYLSLENFAVLLSQDSEPQKEHSQNTQEAVPA
jgi:biopolymer transport protein ExbB